MEEELLPRVNFEVMQQCIGRKVLLVGEVKNVEQASVTLRTSDDAEVHVRTAPGNISWTETPFVEVLCRVVDGRTVQEERHTNFRGPALDLRLYNEMVKLSNTKYAQLFKP